MTNAQFPDQMETLVPVTQLYISIDAPTPDSPPPMVAGLRSLALADNALTGEHPAAPAALQISPHHCKGEHQRAL